MMQLNSSVELECFIKKIIKLQICGCKQSALRRFKQSFEKWLNEWFLPKNSMLMDTGPESFAMDHVG